MPTRMAIVSKRHNNCTATYKRIKLDSHHIKKINFRWVKDLNVRPETIKLLEENIGSML